MTALTITLVLIVTAGLLACHRLLGFYAPSDAAGRDPISIDAAPAGFSWERLIVSSILSLFLELLLIRWISSEIRIFAYFKNFVLVACFLGFGMGCILSRRRVSLLVALLSPLLLVLLVEIPFAPLRVLIDTLPAFISVTSEVHVWGIPAAPGNLRSYLFLAAAAAVMLPIFGLLVLSMIPLGQIVGRHLEESPRGILAYSVNLVAGLIGILLFTFLSAVSSPPAVWFAAAGLLWILLLRKTPGRAALFAVLTVLSVILLSIPGEPDETVLWSPYQKLVITPLTEGGENLGYTLNTNGSWYQQVIDLSPEFRESHEDLFMGVPPERNAYNIPYEFHPAPSSVLILGAGMGNDVAGALRAGADRVVAVEIDPMIVEEGRRLHPENPYGSPRVETIVNDARAYIETNNEQFDMIVFGLLDSHTTTSSFSNIRIDNFVYTLEAIRAVRRLLGPGGVLVIKFQVETPWIAGRLRETLRRVFGEDPIEFEAENSWTTGGRFFIAGEPIITPDIEDYLSLRGGLVSEAADPTTDDWPYFYQKAPGLPLCVIVISGVVLLMTWLSLRGTAVSIENIRWRFFFLGAGFLLLEVFAISRTALLLGTTWMVNSIVISTILGMIVVSNIIASAFPRFGTGKAYILLGIALAAIFLVDAESLFLGSWSARAAVAAILYSLPVLFAGIIFIRTFREEAFSSEALGSNLLGALFGGLVESFSLWTGLSYLIIISALFYAASFMVRPRR